MEECITKRKRTKITDEIINEIKRLVEEGKGRKEIAEELNIGTTTVSEKIKQLGISLIPKNEKVIQNVLELHKNNFTVQQICNEIGNNLSPATVRRYLTDNGLTTNTLKIKPNSVEIAEKVKEYNLGGKTTQQIADLLGISSKTVRNYTNKLGLEINSLKSKPIAKKDLVLSDIQLEILYGSLLGDMCLSDGWKNVRPSISQGGEQEAYFDYKCSFFPGLLGKISKEPRFDKRTNKYYNKFAVRLLAHPLYTEIKKELYPNNVKTVTQEWLDKITPRGLAFWFMDDGSNNGCLATNSFSYEEHLLIKEWFKNEYDIDVNIHKVNLKNKIQYNIFILSKSRLHFEKLIFPYMIPSMYYKLNKLDPNSVNCGEPLRESNTNL